MIEFLIDVASPNAYLADRVLRARGASVAYRPILLGGLFKVTGNAAPMVAYRSVPNKLAYEMRELARFVEANGLAAYRMNPAFPVHTVGIMRAATAVARDEPGDLAPFFERALAAMWEEGRDLSQESERRAVLTEAGLDADRILAAAEEQAIKDALRAATQAAADRGAFGVPTFFVGDEMWFGKERIEAVLAADAASRSGDRLETDVTADA